MLDLLLTALSVWDMPTHTSHHEHSPLALGFVGLGQFATARAEACLRAGGIRIVAGYDPLVSAREAFASAFACAEHSSFTALCADPTITAVILASPNDLHCEQTLALAAAGKAVFVEKPISNTVAEADAMIAACASAGVVLAVGHQERRKRVFRYIKRCIDQGDLGTVYTFEANHCGNLLKIWSEDDWRFQNGRGMGPLLHKGIHKIDTILYLFGAVHSVATMASTLPFNPQMQETTVSILTFANGIMGSLTSGFRYDNATFTISGEHLALSYSGYGNRIRVRNTHTWHTEDIDCGGESDPLAEEVAEFAAALRGEARIEVDGEAARQAIAVATAAREAGERQMIITLPASGADPLGCVVRPRPVCAVTP